MFPSRCPPRWRSGRGSSPGGLGPVGPEDVVSSLPRVPEKPVSRGVSPAPLFVAGLEASKMLGLSQIELSPRQGHNQVWGEDSCHLFFRSLCLTNDLGKFVSSLRKGEFTLEKKMFFFSRRGFLSLAKGLGGRGIHFPPKSFSPKL